MTPYLQVATAWRPRSNAALTLYALLFLATVSLLPVLQLFARDLPSWFGQYLAAMALGGVGTSFGQGLRRVRAWPSALLVPGLLATHICTAVGAITILWTLLLAELNLLQAFDGLPITLSLAVGLLMLLTTAGIHNRAFVLSMVVGVPLMFNDTLRDATLEWIRSPQGNWLCITVSIASVVRLFHAYRVPADARDAEVDQRLLGTQQFLPAPGAKKVAIARYLRLSHLTGPRATRSNPFQLAVEHTSLQAWVNAMAVALCAALPIGLTLVLVAGDVNAAVVAIALANTIMAAAVTAFVLPQFAPLANALWLAGLSNSRPAFLRRLMLQMLAPGLRVATITVGFVLAVWAFGVDQQSISLSLVMLMLGPANSAIVLALLLIGQPAWQRYPWAGTLLLAITTALLLMGSLYVATLFGATSLVLSLLAAAGLSAACATACVAATASIVARRNSWT